MEKVVSILRRNRLAVETEDAIFDAIMRWVRHDVKSRQCHLETLTTGCVNITLLDERYMKVILDVKNLGVQYLNINLLLYNLDNFEHMYFRGANRYNGEASKYT